MGDFATNLLQYYADGTLTPYVVSCESDAGCGGVHMTPRNTDNLLSAMKDGVITQEERARLGFLSARGIDVNSIAGADGREPQRIMAGLLIFRDAGEIQKILKSDSEGDPVSQLLEIFAGHARPERELLLVQALAANDSDVAINVKIKIINGEIEVSDAVRAELIRACDAHFFNCNLGNFSMDGLIAIYDVRGRNDNIGDSAYRLMEAIAMSGRK